MVVCIGLVEVCVCVQCTCRTDTQASPAVPKSPSHCLPAHRCQYPVESPKNKTVSQRSRLFVYFLYIALCMCITVYVSVHLYLMDKGSIYLSVCLSVITVKRLLQHNAHTVSLWLVSTGPKYLTPTTHLICQPTKENEPA